jgi:hypothetical protein
MSVILDQPISLEPLGSFEPEIRKLFRDTLLMGKPLGFRLDEADLYERLSIDWYFTHAPHLGAVAIRDNEVVGYALVCTEPEQYEEWLRAIVWKITRRVFLRLVTFRLSAPSRQFYRLRFLDSFTVWKSRKRLPLDVGAHVHMNIREGSRSGSVALALLGHIDTVCREQNVTSWIGEVNATLGSRERALARVLGEIVAIEPNRTFSALLGLHVNRLTVRRDL